MDMLLEHAVLVPLEGDKTMLEDAYLGISGEKISYIGTVAPEERAVQTIDCRGKAALPGLINCHTHLAMALLRGFADDYPLDTWLRQHIFPVEKSLDARCVRAGVGLALLEALASGTTSVSDIYFYTDAAAQVVREAGVKANLSYSLASMDPGFSLERDAGEALELVKSWHNYDHGRIRAEMGIHSVYTSTPALWEQVSSFASDHGLGIQVHLSETRREQEDCLRTYGCTPARALERAGVFKTRVTAAHCVWTTGEDMDLLAECGATAVHNPVSNLKLASGVAPVEEQRLRGVNVALGTDGMASNNSHDLFEEMKFAALLQKERCARADALDAWTALELATGNGARCQGREAETGSLRVGLDADLILVDFDRPHLRPLHHVESSLVYAARGGDVALTMVRGRILYRDGEFLTMDRERIYWEVEHYVREKMF